MKRKSKLVYCSQESWRKVRVNEQRLVENHLGEAALK